MSEDQMLEASGPIGDDLAVFDIVALAGRGAVMEVRHPNTGEVLRHDDGRPFTVTLYGKDSTQFRNAERTQRDRRIQQMSRTRNPILATAIEKDDIELLVAATLQWDVILGRTPEGAPYYPPSNSREYRAAYTKYPWLKEQVDSFVRGRANFVTAGA